MTASKLLPEIVPSTVHVVALVELHLQWAPPSAQVEWGRISLSETAPPPARKVRLVSAGPVPLNCGTPNLNQKTYPLSPNHKRAGVERMYDPWTACGVSGPASALPAKYSS